MAENYRLRIIWGFKQKESEPQVKEIQTYKDIKSKTRNKKQPTIKAKKKKKNTFKRIKMNTDARTLTLKTLKTEIREQWWMKAKKKDKQRKTIITAE